MGKFQSSPNSFKKRTTTPNLYLFRTSTVKSNLEYQTPDKKCMKKKGARVAQLVKHLTLDFSSGHEMETDIRLHDEHGACLRFSLFLSAPLPHFCPLSLKKKKSMQRDVKCQLHSYGKDGYHSTKPKLSFSSWVPRLPYQASLAVHVARGIFSNQRNVSNESITGQDF